MVDNDIHLESKGRNEQKHRPLDTAEVKILQKINKQNAESCEKK